MILLSPFMRRAYHAMARAASSDAQHVAQARGPATSIIRPRRAFSHPPQSPPMPHRSSFSRQVAPRSTAPRTSRSDIPRQMQTITFRSLPLVWTYELRLSLNPYEHDRAAALFRQVTDITRSRDPWRTGTFACPSRSGRAEVPVVLAKWSGQEDLNLRPHGPEPCALTRLSYAPSRKGRGF